MLVLQPTDTTEPNPVEPGPDEEPEAADQEPEATGEHTETASEVDNQGIAA
jgi:hypothetical protein